MMQLIIIVVTCLTVMTDVAATIMTPSTPLMLSPALSSSSHPVVASTPSSPETTQDQPWDFGPEVHRTTNTPSKPSQPTATECPDGFQQSPTPCTLWFYGVQDFVCPLCHNGTLQVTQRFTTNVTGSCFNPESAIRSSVRDFLLDPSGKSDDITSPKHPGSMSGWRCPLVSGINASVLRHELEDALESDFRDPTIRSSRCASVMAFDIICSPERDRDDLNLTLLSSSDCNKDWFFGHPEDFTSIFDQVTHILFFNGTYILPHWWIDRTTYVLETLEVGRQGKTRDIGVCGEILEFVTICSIVLTKNQYSLGEEGGSTFALYRGKKYSSEEFEYLSNDSIRICTVHMPGDKTYFLLDEYDIYDKVMGVISTLCLLLLVITYMTFPELRNFQGCAILSFVIAMLMSKILGDYIALYIPLSSIACKILAVIVHFTYLSIFSWMNLLAFDLCWNFRGTQTRVLYESTNRLKRYARYSLFGWGVPLVIVLIAIGLHFTENEVFPLKYGSGPVICSLEPKLALNVFFVVPLFVSVIVNIVLFGITVVNICKTTRTTRRALEQKRVQQRRNVIKELLIYFKISCLLGFDWLMGPLAGWIGNSVALWYIFTTVTAAQGIFLFFCFGLNARVRKMWREKAKSCCSCPCWRKGNSARANVANDAMYRISQDTCL